MDDRFQTTFVMHSFGVDHLHFVDCTTRIREFTIQLTLGTISRIQKSTRLFNLTTEGIGFAFSNTNSLHDFLTSTGLFFITLNGITELPLITLDGLLTFSIGLVGMIKSNFKLIDVRLQLLFDTKSFTLSTLFGFKRGSKRLHGTLVVLPGVIKLLFLFLNTAVNFLTNLSKFKLSSQDLVFFLFKSSFSLFQSSLEFFFFYFQTTTLFVQFMDGSTTISKLVQEILDFISQVFVFSLHHV